MKYHLLLINFLFGEKRRLKLEKIEKLGNLTYNEDCDHCMSNPFTLDAMETKKTLEKDKEFKKNMYVSPFIEMDCYYKISVKLKDTSNFFCSINQFDNKNKQIFFASKSRICLLSSRK